VTVSDKEMLFKWYMASMVTFKVRVQFLSIYVILNRLILSFQVRDIKDDTIGDTSKCGHVSHTELIEESFVFTTQLVYTCKATIGHTPFFLELFRKHLNLTYCFHKEWGRL